MQTALATFCAPRMYQYAGGCALQGQRARKLRVSCRGSCLRAYPYCMHSGIKRSTCWSYQPRRRCRRHLHICRQCPALTRAVAFLGLPSTLRPHRTLEKLLELLSVMGHTSVQLGASMIMVRIVIPLHAGRPVQTCKCTHAHPHICMYMCIPPSFGRPPHTYTMCTHIMHACMHTHSIHMASVGQCQPTTGTIQRGARSGGRAGGQ